MNIFKPADILIPGRGTDFTKWSVVACDQYTSEPEYWEDVKRETDGYVSSLNLIFPEVYLEKDDAEERIAAIHRTMEEYISDGIFEELTDAYVYVERTQSDGRVRRGVVGAIDLEAYDYGKDARPPVRATEGTIIERIPPRMRVRRGAALELPHIMLLADDRENKIIAPLSEKTDSMRTLYDFDLMKGSGHIRGMLPDEGARADFEKALAAFTAEKTAESRRTGDEPLIFAVGDGNHSLAAAKSCWEEIKKTLTAGEAKRHPARYALAELVNLYDDALNFEPIHRVVFDVDVKKLLDALFKYYPDASYEDNGGQRAGYTYGGKSGNIYIRNGKSNIPVGSVQAYIDYYIAENGGRVDYIHGEDAVRRLAAEENRIGFTFDAIKKEELYPTVIKDGSLPRKTFSMGEAADKRFYIEAKRLKY